MKNINKKLKSEKGASILLALMLFLVCFMVASVILSSATANADKLHQREDNQREYLSVSSAATLLRDVLGGIEYTGWENNKVFYYQDESAINLGTQEDIPEKCEAMVYTEEKEARMRAELERAIYQAFSSHTKWYTKVPVADVLTKEFVISGEGMEEIKVVLSLDTKTYYVTCELTQNDSSGTNNAMTVLFKAAVHKDDSPQSREYTDENFTYWEAVPNADGEGTHWESRLYRIVEYKIVTKISYDAGTITKGVYP